MSRTVIGADRVRRKLTALKKTVKREVDRANEISGGELIATARILHPGDGSTKAGIHGQVRADGSYLADFGDKAKVTEGDRGPRPFVNPALKVLRKRHSNRAKRAVNKAVKQAFSGG